MASSKQALMTMAKRCTSAASPEPTAGLLAVAAHQCTTCQMFSLRSPGVLVYLLHQFSAVYPAHNQAYFMKTHARTLGTSTQGLRRRRLPRHLGGGLAAAHPAYCRSFGLGVAQGVCRVGLFWLARLPTGSAAGGSVLPNVA